MPQLLKGIINVIDVFYKNAQTDGGCQRLSKQELKQLLQEEFGEALQVKRPRVPCTEKSLTDSRFISDILFAFTYWGSV